MSAPTLRAVPIPPPLAAVFGEHASAFLVEHSGHLGPRPCWRGELLVTSGPARAGQAVVLVARGPGRPRCGAITDAGLLVGDRGEPCSPCRWRVAGRWVAAARQAGTEWSIEPIDGHQVAVAAVPYVGAGRTPRLRSRAEPAARAAEPAACAQLPLFGQAHAGASRRRPA